ncbi:MAG: hypothetical protein IPP69_00535 [Flavobacteriales bacterium]|nr:hypothetical protein [Flavobacteriales bacterium]
MEKDIVHKAIGNREILFREGSGSWEELTNRYPYFAAAHLLLLKSWQREGDHRFTDQLHQAAIHTNDRKALYQFVKSDFTSSGLVADVAPETIPVDKVASVISPVEIEVANAPLITEEVAQPIPFDAGNLAAVVMGEEESATVVAKETLVSVEQDTPVMESIPVQEAISNEIQQEIQEEISEEIKPVRHAADLDPYERNLLVEAVRSSIEVEVSEKETGIDDQADSSVMPSEMMPDEQDQSFAAHIMRRSRQLHFGEGTATTPNQEELPTGAIGDWLRKDKSENTDQNSEDQESLDQPFQTGVSHGARKIEVKDQKSHQKDLIDRFIRMEPQIARGKSTDFTPGNIAKESLEEDFSLVTETMAKLFIAQGKIDKARKAFRKLMELFPEKSVYFAAQLKNLDKTKK